MGKCIVCKKEIEGDLILCGKHTKELRDSFQYSVGGTVVTKEHFNAIVKRGYVIPEELDKIRGGK